MADASLATTDLPPLTERVEERQVGPCRLLLLRTPVQGVVSWTGSFLSAPDFASGEELIQELTVSLLDKGTKRRDRFAIAEALENRGAKLSFSSEELWVGFRGQALREDVPEVMAALAEQLREPLLDPAEFAKAQAQLAARYQRSLENTGAQASGALRRLIYGNGHPNYAPPTQQSLERLASTTVDDVRDYHARHFGSDELILAVVGDLDPDALTEALREGLGDWPEHTAATDYESVARERDPGVDEVPMPEKPNVDVRLGQAIPIRRDHDDYLALYLGIFLLGGNFSARLMHTVRDEMGLTYGIRARLQDIHTRYEGHLQVNVTLSQDALEQGEAATRSVIATLLDEGATADEVAANQTTLTGSFTVGLATTRGLALALHRNARRGFDVAYLDAFPERVEALTPEQVNTALRRYVQPDAFHRVRAGTLPDGA
jgi:predicted Zn-dependent peptidase